MIERKFFCRKFSNEETMFVSVIALQIFPVHHIIAGAIAYALEFVWG
jgi:hypothetical protein